MDFSAFGSGFGLDAGNFAGAELGSFADVAPSNSSPYASGFWQQLGSTVIGQLPKVVDVELQRRLAGSMPYPQQWGIGGEVRLSQYGPPVAGQLRPATQTFDLGGLLPWLLIGGAVYFVARK